MSSSWTKNFLILLPVAAAIAAAATLLYQDYHSGPMSGEDEANREVIGEILYTDNNVKRQFGDDVMWNSIEKKMPVYNKDSIRTGKDSTAGIKLTDNTVIDLGENSLIVLDKFQQNFNINFKAGDISTKNSSQATQVQVKDSVIKGAGSELKIKTGPDAKTRIEVAKGKAVLTDKNKKTIEVGESEEAGLNDAGVEEVHKIAIVLKSPENKSQLQTNQSEIRQPFTWSVSRPNLKTEQFEISKTVSFKPGLTRSYNAHQAVTASISQGTYFWRVGWLEKDKLLYTETRQVTVAQDKRLELVFPENDTRFDVEPEENSLELQWKSEIPVKAFVVEVSSTADFRNIVNTQTIPQKDKLTKVAVKNLPSRTYFWRVKAFGEKNEELAVSPVNVFTVKVRLPSLPELTKPFPDAVWSEPGPVIFSWKKMDKAKDYRISISSDLEHRGIVKTKTGPETTFSWKWPKRDNAQQVYYWNVTALSATSAIVGQSEIRKFSIKVKDRGSAFVILNPKDKSIVLRELTGNNPDPILFQWQLTRPVPGPVSVVVANNEEFAGAEKYDAANSLSHAVQFKKAGVYFWKLVSASATDKENQEFSEAVSFTLKHANNLLGPQLLEPTNKDKLETTEPMAVKFSWKPAVGAVQYHIVVERVDTVSNEHKPVMDRVVKETFITSALLPEGSYSWTVSSMDVQGQEGPASHRFEFQIVPLEEMAAPKLNAPVVK